MNKIRTQEIRDEVEDAIRYTGRFFHCTFGKGWTDEEKDYAIHIGANFNVYREGDALAVNKPASGSTLSGI